MRRTPLLPLTALLVACATVGVGPDMSDVLERGLNELSRQNYAAASEHLRLVSESQPADEIGRRALLLRTTAALDPRNPGRDFAQAAELAAQLRDSGEGWSAQIGESLRMVSAELEETHERAASAEGAREAGLAVSAVMQRALAVRLDSLRIERDTLRRRATLLEQTLSEREKQLKDKEQELERIRKIIRN